MRRAGSASRLQVQSQARAYAAVAGVTVSMLVVGLAIPLAFGHTPSSATAQATASTAPTFAPEAPAPTTAPTAPGVSGPSAHPVVTVGPVAPSGGGAPSGPAGRATQAPGVPAAGSLTASDQGVTATTIKLGVVLLDIQALAPLGFSQPHFSPQEQQQQYQFFIDQVNRSGGVLGRRLVPDFKTWNALDNNGSQSAPAVCQQLSDDKVFAVIGVNANTGPCLTEQHHLPTISNTGDVVEVYKSSHNLLITPYASLERGAADWGDLASRSGILNGRKIGTVHNVTPQEARPEQALVSALKTAGHPVTYRSSLSADEGSAQSQLPIEVQKMQAAGVNTVFLVTNFIQAIQFVQTADKQGFRPQYVVSDLGSLTAEGLVSSMPASFNGAYAWGESNPGSPENPQDRTCRLDWNAGTGNHYAAGNDSGGLTLFCWMVKAFRLGADAAGPRLTRPGLAAAFQGLNGVALPHMLGGSFGPGKTDFADYLQPRQYATSCKCYRSIGGAQKGRY